MTLRFGLLRQLAFSEELADLLPAGEVFEVQLGPARSWSIPAAEAARLSMIDLAGRMADETGLPFDRCYRALVWRLTPPSPLLNISRRSLAPALI